MKKKIIWFALIVLLISGTAWGVLEFSRCSGAAFSTETTLSLIVAILTLEATICVALFVYSLQNSAEQREARKRKSSAKQVLFKELDTGLEAIVRAPKAGDTGEISSHLSQLLISFLPSIQDSLSGKELHHLIKLVDVLSNMAKLQSSDGEIDGAEYIQGYLGLFVREQFISAMRSPYAEYFAQVDDHHRVLAPITRSLLEALSGQKLLPPATDRLVRSGEQEPFLEVFPDGRCRMTDRDGGLLCNAVLDDDAPRGIASGWARLDDYEGEYENGKRHGRGTSYSLLGHHRVFTGLWEEGKLKQGTQFNTVLQRKAGQKGFQELFPYWDEHHFLPSHVTDYMIKQSDRDDGEPLVAFFVVDVQIFEDSFLFEEDDLRPMEDFMRENDPEALARYQAYRNGVWDDTADPDEEEEALAP